MPPATFIILENKYKRRTFRFRQIAFTKKLLFGWANPWCVFSTLKEKRYVNFAYFMSYMPDCCRRHLNLL